MKILVYGSKGWIGQQVIQILDTLKYKYETGKSRVNNKEDVKKELDDIKPTHVMSFIGRTHGKIKDKLFTTIDYLEQPGKVYENVRDNLFSPLVLALECQK